MRRAVSPVATPSFAPCAAIAGSKYAAAVEQRSPARGPLWCTVIGIAESPSCRQPL